MKNLRLFGLFKSNNQDIFPNCFPVHVQILYKGQYVPTLKIMCSFCVQCFLLPKKAPFNFKSQARFFLCQMQNVYKMWISRIKREMR